MFGAIAAQRPLFGSRSGEQFFLRQGPAFATPLSVLNVIVSALDSETAPRTLIQTQDLENPDSKHAPLWLSRIRLSSHTDPTTSKRTHPAL